MSRWWSTASATNCPQHAVYGTLVPRALGEARCSRRRASEAEESIRAMCGIVGIAHCDPSHAVARQQLHGMCDAMVHRGPDDFGLHVDRHVGIAMRRLSIIDLGTGRQPIANEDETVWVVLNGEIYNYRQLRQELEAAGHRFRTTSDTEVIVHLFEERGEECVQRLRGMFAF